MPTPMHESEVLIPQDTSIDENDWAQIELGNVEVSNADGKLVSLLRADWDRPLTVVGRLQDVEEEQAHLLRNPLHANATVKVTNVTRFSYAEYSDKSVALYARGEAGWFILGKPARPYSGIYQDMIEAVEVMYFLVDYHRQTSKDIFEEYARSHARRCPTPEAAAELYNKHREFLVWMMLAKKENVTWGATSFYHHLRQRFPDVFAAMRQRLEERASAEQKKPTQAKARGRPRLNRSNSLEREESRNLPQAKPPPEQPPKRPRGRPRKYPSPPVQQQPPRLTLEDKMDITPVAPKMSTPSTAPKKDANWWEAKVIWELLQKASSQGLISNDDLTTLNLASILTRKYTIDDPHLATIYIRAHAPNLLYMMAHKRRPHLDWTSTYIFHELSTTRVSPKQLDHILHIELRQRKREAPPPQHSSVSISSDSENHRARRRGPSRSVLRPRGSKVPGKAAAKAAARRGARYAGRNAKPQVGDSDDSDTVALASPTKRKSVDEAHGRARKRAASEVNVLNARVLDSSSDNDAGGKKAPAVTTVTSKSLPLRWKSPPPSPDATPRASPMPFIPLIISAPLPSTTANLKGQGDTWICSLDGCMHKVYGASEDDSQELIKLHYQEHARSQERVELVRREGVGVGLPVSNLIRRIREMAEAQQGVLPPLVSTGLKFPTAIERRY